jgi:hypothetical protein
VNRRWLCLALLLGALQMGERSGYGQIDPVKRQLLQFGYNQPLEGQGPIAGYAFYFLNRPEFYRTNVTLRLAVAPVFMDGEVGFRGLLGEHTDLGIGVSGGGFADTHEEIRAGSYRSAESFTGHGAEISAAVYHLFNPDERIPLYGIARVGGHFTRYIRDDDTAAGFVIPDDRNSLRVRMGFRLGGREPLLTPALALEASAWYEGNFYDWQGPFGFAGDRLAESTTHKFWSRALLAYTFPKRGDYLTASVTAGTSLQADRLNAYQLGSALPLSSEFPLYLPGYYFGEISARRFILLGGLYAFPLDSQKRWTINGFATTSFVDYVAGMQQPGKTHSGIGGGLGYRSPEKIWQVILSYGYGVDAIRNNRRGTHAVGILVQYDLEAKQRLRPTFEPGIGPDKSRGLERFIRRLNIFK